MWEQQQQQQQQQQQHLTPINNETIFESKNTFEKCETWESEK